MTDTLHHGDIVVDRDQADPDPAVVVNTPPVQVTEWYVRPLGCTVAEDNPTYPADDDVVAIVYKNELDEHRPYYSGHGHLDLGNLSRDGVSVYFYPESRLRPVGEIEPTPIPLDEIRASPYHARNFEAAANREYIVSIREQGNPKPTPLLRAVDDRFEVVNGHKRTWASHVAGLDEIQARVIHIDDWEAARRFVQHHLTGTYSHEEARVALCRLRERWGNRINGVDMAQQYRDLDTTNTATTTA